MFPEMMGKSGLFSGAGKRQEDGQFYPRLPKVSIFRGRPGTGIEPGFFRPIAELATGRTELRD